MEENVEKNPIQNEESNVEPKVEEKPETNSQHIENTKSKKTKFVFMIILIATIAIIAVYFKPESTNTDNGEIHNSSEDKQTTKSVSLVINETTTVENVCELTVVNNKITKKIEPPYASGYYSYFEADENKSYLDVIVDVKNLAVSSVRQDSMFTAKVYVDGSEYTSKLIIEKDEGTDLSGYTNLYSIEALETLRYHVATQLPSDKLVAGKTIKLVFTANNKEYVYTITLISDETKTEEEKSSTINLSAPVPKLVANETLTVENICQLTIIKSNLASRINPPSASGYYHYYQADDGKVYFDLVADIKNLKPSAVTQDSVIGRVKLIYNGTYEYDCSLIVEEDNGSDLNGYTNLYDINPLETMRYHIICQVPKELQDSQGSLEVIFSIAGEEYSFQAR